MSKPTASDEQLRSDIMDLLSESRDLSFRATALRVAADMNERVKGSFYYYPEIKRMLDNIAQEEACNSSK